MLENLFMDVTALPLISFTALKESSVRVTLGL